MPKLEELHLGLSPVGKTDVAALAAPLRKLPALKTLGLSSCGIGDEGVASLVADLGKDAFKALKEVYLDGNSITDAGCATLVSAIDGGRMPRIEWIYGLPLFGRAGSGLHANSASSVAARRAVSDAVSRAKARRSS